jgi:hypothetical protein
VLLRRFAESGEESVLAAAFACDEDFHGARSLACLPAGANQVLGRSRGTGNQREEPYLMR